MTIIIEKHRQLLLIHPKNELRVSSYAFVNMHLQFNRLHLIFDVYAWDMLNRIT